MGTARDWLQLFRSHTSPLEMTITICGSALALGTIFDLKVVLFLFFGWLYHNAGYGQNSVEDYIRGFDRDDPNKAHHPLQRGAIEPYMARNVCRLLIAILFIYGVIISGFDPLSIFLLATLIAMGIVYNLFNKEMTGKFIPIAIAHSLLLPFAFFGSGGTLEFSSSPPYLIDFGTRAALLLFGYLLLQVIYQIMIEGDLKDIDMDEASLLKRMGVHVKDGILHTSHIARGSSFLVKASSVTVLFLALSTLNATIDNYVGAAVFGIILLILDQKLMGSGPWEHSQCLKLMSLMEVASTFAIAIAIAPEIGGWMPAVLIMAFNMVYFVLMNRFLWGTVIKPRV
jgi:1,4-dihydroxy-2-naphthoate octaprenyltransferase